MWAQALAQAGELWLFDDGVQWGAKWRAHISWKRMDDEECALISGLKMEGYSQDAREAILAELGRLGFTKAAWFRMKQGKRILRKVKIMAKNESAAAEDRVDEKVWVEFGYIDDKGRRVVQRTDHEKIPHRVTRGVQLAVVGGLLKLPGDDLSDFAAALTE